MKKIIICLIVCLFVLSVSLVLFLPHAEVEESESTTEATKTTDPETETETETETGFIITLPLETEPESPTETATEPITDVQDPLFGLTSKEFECVARYIETHDLCEITDIVQIDCLGFLKIPTENGEVVKYDQKQYAIILNTGACIMLNVNVEDLQE